MKKIFLSLFLSSSCLIPNIMGYTPEKPLFSGLSGLTDIDPFESNQGILQKATPTSCLKSFCLANRKLLHPAYRVDQKAEPDPSDLEQTLQNLEGSENVETTEVWQELSSIDIQRKLLGSQDDQESSKVKDLKNLTENNLILTRKSLLNLQNDFQHNLLQIDLFENNNWAKATSKALDFILSDQAPDTVQAVFAQNEQLRDDAKTLVTSLNQLAEKTTSDLSDEAYNQLFSQIVEQADLFSNRLSQSCSANASVVLFWQDFTKLLQVITARYAADQLMNQLRARAEQALTEDQKATQVSASIKLPFLGKASQFLNGKFGGSIQGKTESTDPSLFSIQAGGAVYFEISADIGSFHVGAQASLDTMQSELFFSLEQFLDSGQATLKMTNADLKDLIKTRINTQKDEEELLRRFGELEGFYKIFQAVPQSVYVNWDDISQSLPVDTVTTYGLSGNLEASLKDSLGLSLQQTIERKIYTKHKGLLALLSEDCSPAENLTFADLADKIGEAYDLSEKIALPQVLYGNLYAYNATLEQLANDHATTQTSKLKDRKHSYEALLTPTKKRLFKKNPGRYEVLQSAVLTAASMKEASQTLSDQNTFRKIYQQLNHLAKLQKFSKNVLRRNPTISLKTEALNISTLGQIDVNVSGIGNVKVNITKNKMKGHPFQTENGEKSCIEFTLPGNISPSNIKQKLQDIIQNLFAKIKDKIGDAIEDKLEQIGVSISRDGGNDGDTTDRQSESKASKNREISLENLFFQGSEDHDAASEEGLKGIGEIKKIIDAVRSWFGSSEKLTDTINETWSVLIDKISSLLATPSFKISIPLVKVLANTSENSAETANVLPLPGQSPIFKTQNTWVPQSVKLSSIATGDISIETKLIQLNRTQQTIQEQSLFFEDSLTPLMTKFNALRLGLESDESDDTPNESINLKNWSTWQNFKQAHEKEIVALCQNINDTNSNSRYELQTMFNDIQRQISLQNSKKCSNLFESFLKACSRIQKGDDTSLVNQAAQADALQALDQVLEYNFLYNFLPSYNKA